MILRVVLAAFCLVALAVSGLSVYVRFTPLDTARWHADVVTSEPPARGTCTENITVLQNGARSVCVLPGTPAEILARLDATALSTRRTTRLAGSPGEGRVSWVSRSKLIGYPDIITAQTTAQTTGTRLDVFSRQVYGGADFGVNAARLQDWLTTF